MTSVRSSKHAALDGLLRQSPLLWRGKSQLENTQPDRQYIDTGYTALNAILPGGGWPTGCLIELVISEWGQGELSLLMPLIVWFSQAKRPVIFIASPYIPYAPALKAAGVALQNVWLIDNQGSQKDLAWAAEKSLSTEQDALVLLCLPGISAKQVRRLHVAVCGRSVGVLLRCGKAMQSPVPLRLAVRYEGADIMVSVLKARQVSKQTQTVLLKP